MKLRRIALWGNLLYLVAIVAALSVALGVATVLDAPSWSAFGNVTIFIALAAATGILNIRCLRRKRWAAVSTVAIGLNAICLAYLLVRPEYAHVLIKIAVALIPALNISVLIGDRRIADRSPSPNSMNGRAV